MSRKNINFDDKKIKQSVFYRNTKANKTDDIDVNNTLISKKKHTVQKIHLNTLLDLMIMISLDHYVQNFGK